MQKDDFDGSRCLYDDCDDDCGEVTASRYADLLIDDVFKLAFGQESTKDVMIEFLDRVISDRKIFDVAELANMDEVKRSEILRKMTTERDLRNQMAYATQVGREEGLEEALASS